MLVDFEFLSGDRVWFYRSDGDGFNSANIGTIDKISLVNYKSKWYFEIEMIDFSWFTKDKFIESWAGREILRTSKEFPQVFKTYEELINHFPELQNK